MTTFTTNLQGVNFRGADIVDFVRNELNEDTELSLERDPENEYDANAIKVFARAYDGKLWIGFVEKSIAEDLAPAIDSGEAVRSISIVGWLNPLKPVLEIVMGLTDDEDEEAEEEEFTEDDDAGDDA